MLFIQSSFAFNRKSKEMRVREREKTCCTKNNKPPPSKDSARFSRIRVSIGVSFFVIGTSSLAMVVNVRRAESDANDNDDDGNADDERAVNAALAPVRRRGAIVARFENNDATRGIRFIEQFIQKQLRSSMQRHSAHIAHIVVVVHTIIIII
jgi:hypothetical protein